jgi:hypothetical protein
METIVNFGDRLYDLLVAVRDDGESALAALFGSLSTAPGSRSSGGWPRARRVWPT